MGDQYVGEIRLFSFSRAPNGWALCQGQPLAISQYEVLFTLIGTAYGGDGMTSFNVPDLRGRVPIHLGQGNGLPNYALAQMGGDEQVSLTASTMPSHGHALTSTTNLASTPTPATNVHLATSSNNGAAGGALYAPPAGAGPFATMNGNAVSVTGQGAPHNNMMPTLVGNWCIATDGIFPSGN